MKKEKLWLLAAVAAAVVLAFVPDAGAGILGALALPFTAAGWLLRTLSLSGALGNVVSIILYAAGCFAPILLWLRSRKQAGDWLLLLLPMVLAVVLYYMVNPNLRGGSLQNEAGDAVYACSVWSLLITWGILKLIGSGSSILERNIYRALRLFLLLCAASCLMNAFGTSISEVRLYFEHFTRDFGIYEQNRMITFGFLMLKYLMKMAEGVLTARVLVLGAGLMTVLEAAPFSEACVDSADFLGRKCRETLLVISVASMMVNLGQVLLSPVLLDISMEVRIPVLSMAVCFAVLVMTKLLVKGKELKDESDLFV